MCDCKQLEQGMKICIFLEFHARIVFATLDILFHENNWEIVMQHLDHYTNIHSCISDIGIQEYLSLDMKGLR